MQGQTASRRAISLHNVHLICVPRLAAGLCTSPVFIHIPVGIMDSLGGSASTDPMQPVAFARVLGLDITLKNQNGVIRRDQAIAAGVSRARLDDLVRRGRWRAILPRVYVVGEQVDDPRVRVRACWLWAGDLSTIAGSAAAWWLGLAQVRPRTVTVIIPPTARRDLQPGVRVVRGQVDPLDTQFEDWIRVTKVARTCLDLARQAEPDGMETALRMRRTDIPRLQKSLQRASGRRGQVRARSAVEEVVKNPWSYGERLAHGHLMKAGITGWVANPPVRLRDGIRYPDVAFEDLKLAIEIDGHQHHGTREAFENDRARDNQFVEAGWTVLHFTWRQLTEHPERMIATINTTVDRLRAGRALG